MICIDGEPDCQPFAAGGLWPIASSATGANVIAEIEPLRGRQRR